MVDWKEITYPITLQYREHWKEWESIRELVQNSLDSNNEYKAYREGNNFIIEDNGKGLQVKHLLFGVSEKGSNARGRFGEGLKIALIVLKRLGYNVTIISNDLEVKIDTTEIEGNQCLKILYRHNGKVFNGTRITIEGYDKEDFKDRFITDTKRIIVKNTYGSLLKSTSSKSQLYVKDIYVQELDNSQFSYNINDLELEESRNVANEYSLQHEIGYLWNNINDLDLWIKLFESIEKGKYEKKIKFKLQTIRHKETVLAAFNKVFPNSVLHTDDNWSREAQWRNKSIVEVFDSYEHEQLFNILPTDKKFVIEQNNKKDIEVKEETLTETQKANLDIIRKIAKSFKYDVKVYLLENAEGKAGNPIKIHKYVLNETIKSLSVLIHEITHNYYNCEDLTGNMIHKLSDMAALILSEHILKDSFSTKLLSSTIRVKDKDYEQFRVSIPKELITKIGLSKGEYVDITIDRKKVSK